VGSTNDALENSLAGAGGTISVGAHDNVHPGEGLVALLAGDVVVALACNHLSTAHLVNATLREDLQVDDV